MGNDPKVESEIKAVLDEMSNSFKEKDIDKYMSLVAKESNIIIYGTEMHDKYVNYDDYKEAIKKDFQRFEEASIIFDWLSINSSGSVAWFAGDITLKAKVSTRGISLPGRMTGVLIKEKGKWKFIQTHFSMPTPAPGDM